MTAIATLNKSVEGIKKQVIEWRQHLHQNPELSFQEEKTAQFVYETLSSFGNLEVSRPVKNSVMARLIGSQPGKVLAMRADMDALPIMEENKFDFVSKNPGVMHACGHDGHTAMLLGVAKLLSDLKDKINGEIRFLFQHAEEVSPGGAYEMVQAGVMDGVDIVIGAHLWSTMEVGTVGICSGPMMAATDTFSITIFGKGGHAALPHETIDSISIASQVVTNLQHIVSRNTDPLENLVLSVTKFSGGTTNNVIPGAVEILGTVRSFEKNLNAEIPILMDRIIKGITEAHGASYEFEYEHSHPAVINDAEVTKLVEEVAIETLGQEGVEYIRPNMGGEDFAFFQEKAPGCFFFVSAGNKEKGITYPHHHPHFTIDEDALEIGVKMFVNAAIKIVMEDK